MLRPSLVHTPPKVELAAPRNAARAHDDTARGASSHTQAPRALATSARDSTLPPQLEACTVVGVIPRAARRADS
eukprot:7293290-Prymnesium_polylepis.3